MRTLSASRPDRKPRRRVAALGWPDWTDEIRLELGPDADDVAPADVEPTGPSADDDQWHADQTPDDEGLTDDDAARFEINVGTDSPLDVLLTSIDRDADEAAMMDRYERGVVLA